MKNLNEWEKHVISEGLEMVVLSMTEKIRKAESEGKNHIFHESYMPMVVDVIKDKLEIK